MQSRCGSGQGRVELQERAQPRAVTRAAVAESSRQRLKELCELLAVRDLELAVEFLRVPARARRPLPRPRARPSDKPPTTTPRMSSASKRSFALCLGMLLAVATRGSKLKKRRSGWTGWPVLVGGRCARSGGRPILRSDVGAAVPASCRRDKARIQSRSIRCPSSLLQATLNEIIGEHLIARVGAARAGGEHERGRRRARAQAARACRRAARSGYTLCSSCFRPRPTRVGRSRRRRPLVRCFS